MTPPLCPCHTSTDPNTDPRTVVIRPACARAPAASASHVPQLRYQLLTATAAVLTEADRRSSERAVFIVHECVTPLTLQEERDRNAVDLDRFLATALDHEGHLAPGDVAGPILVKGAPTPSMSAKHDP